MDKWLLLTCTALLLLHSALAEVDSCVLDGFDLSDLDRANYWNVTIAKENCIVPKDYTENNITHCTVHFSVCKPLPPTVCVNHTNSSTCQVVTTKDKKTHYFNIGDYQASNNELQPMGGMDVGFGAIRRGDSLNSTSCNDTYNTVITWKCEPTTVWDHSKKNVTFLAEFTFGSCLLELSFNYSGACYVAPTLAPEKCRLDPYNLTGLETEDYWFATLPNTTCLATNATSCNIYFSFCQALPLSIGGGCYESAVCQVGNTSVGEVSYNMGQLNIHTHFVEARDEVVGGGFYLDVDNGDNPGCEGIDKRISTRVVLTCNSTAHWTNQNLTSITHVSQLGCEYTILLPYAGACLPTTPNTTHTPTATPSPTSTHPATKTSTPAKTHTANSTVSPTPTSTRTTKSTSAHGGKSSTTKSHTPAHTPTTPPPPPGHTTPEHPTKPHTTQKQPSTNPTKNPDSQKIAGLTAGLVIFMIISLVLLVLFIITAWFIYKRRGTGDYQKLEDKM